MSKDYWIKRRSERLTLLEQLEDSNIKKIQGALNKAVDEIQLDIYNLYSKYAVDNKMSYSSAFLYLNNDERKEFQKSLKDYIRLAEDERTAIMYKKELQGLSVRARVKRLEILKATLMKNANNLYNILSKDIFKELYEESYLHNIFSIEKKIGTGVRFDLPNERVIKKLSEYPWSGSNYSSKIWNISDNFVKTLDTVITRGMIQGKNSNVIARELSEKALGKKDKNGNVKGGTLYECKRLVRTESAYITEQATLDSYEELDVKKYEFLATLDTKTSVICQNLDGEKFKTKDIKIGINYPPMHCFCRSTTIPIVFEDDEDISRVARNASTNKNEFIDNQTYKEWKKSTLKSGYDYTEDGIIKPTKRVPSSASNKLFSKPFEVIETSKLLKDGFLQKDRTFYDKNGKLVKQIHSGHHNKPKNHKLGKYGEHAHVFEWNDNKLINRYDREINELEKIENKDILRD